MKKAVILVVLGLVVVAALLAGIKAWQIRAMIAQGQQFVPPPEVVTAASVKAVAWETQLTAVGTLDAVQGVELTAELPGKVVKIAFESGSQVAAGDLLVQQEVAVEKAQLKAAEASVELARVNFERAKTLLPIHSISQSEYDDARAKLTQSQAQIDNIQAQIAQKTLRAPFAGRLGIRRINLGQVINSGQVIANLQSIGPILVDFSLPQQRLGELRKELEVRVTTDALPDQVVSGRITAIDPEVDSVTRNIHLQALVDNPDEQLRPGMYVNVAVVLPQQEDVLIIPAAAVLYAPYSDSVFVIEEQTAKEGKAAGLSVRQQFVQLGEKRGDFVVVEKGLESGERVVSTGAFKLRHGQAVVIDNKLAPDFKLNPQPAEG